MQNRRDGLVRSVKVRVADGYISRSIRSLIFLKHLDGYQGEEGKQVFTEKIDPPRDDEGCFVHPPEENEAQAVEEEGPTVVAPPSRQSTEIVSRSRKEDEGPGSDRETEPISAARPEESGGRQHRSGRVFPGGVVGTTRRRK